MTDPAHSAEHVSGAIGDRIAGGVLALLAIAAWWHAGTFVAPFRQTVGPSMFPQLISAPLAALSLYLLFRPGINERWPQYAALLRQIALVVLLVGYATVLDELGFLIATMMATVVLTRLFGANWKQAVVSSTVLTIALYALFEIALGIALPNFPLPGN